MKLGKYTIQKMLGKGGIGRVFLCIDDETNKFCAIKELQQNNYENRCRFEREYKFLSEINHPNIIKAFDFLNIHNNLFIVMELAKGISLEEFILKHPLISLKEQIAIATQITQAIEIINSLGILHRDIKPANIMIDSSNHIVKILDLGMGKELENSEQEKLTQKGSALGTLHYMSPEQINGNISNNSDVFSVAIVLYQFFSWEKKSVFAAPTLMSTIQNITHKKIPLLHKNIPNINRNDLAIYQKVGTLLSKALIKKSSKRTTSCQKLASDLNNIYYKIRGTSHWRPTAPANKKSRQNMRTIRTRVKRDFTNNTISKSTNKKYIFAIFFLLCITFFIAISNLNITSNKRNEPKTIFSFSNYVINIQDLIYEKRYEKALDKIYYLDKQDIKLFKINQANKTAKLIKRFYSEKWDSTSIDLASQIVKNKDDLLGWLYSIRLFVCMGEVSLAKWYAITMSSRHPIFCEKLQHPVIDIASYHFYNGYTKLENYKRNLTRNKESKICEVFFQILQLLKSDLNTNIEHYSVPKSLSHTVYPSLANFIKADYGTSKKRKKLASVWPHLKNLANKVFDIYPNHHYTNNRMAFIEVEINKNINYLRGKLSFFAKKYPLFLPTRLFLGEFINLESSEFTHCFTGENKDYLKGIIYQILQGVKNFETYKNYINYLYKYFTYWHFTHMYKAKLQNSHKDYYGYAKHIMQFMRQNSQLYNNQIPWMRLNPGQKIEIALQLKWMFHFSQKSRYKNMLVKMSNNLNDIVKSSLKSRQYKYLAKIVRKYNRIKNNQKNSLLKNSSYLEDENVYLAQQAVVVGEYDDAVKMAKNSFPLINAIQASKEKNFQKAKYQLEKHLGVYPLARYEYVFSCVCLEIAQNFYNKKAYQDAMAILLMFNNPHFGNKRIHMLYEIYVIKDKNFTLSANINNVIIALETYIKYKKYTKAEKCLAYASFLKHTQQSKSLETLKTIIFEQK